MGGRGWVTSPNASMTCSMCFPFRSGPASISQWLPVPSGLWFSIGSGNESPHFPEPLYATEVKRKGILDTRFEGSGICLVRFVALMVFEEVLIDGLAPGETFIHSMPVADFRLAHLPAEVNLLSVKQSREVNQTCVEVLDHTA